MSQRPKIKVPYQPIDTIIELVNIALIILVVLYTITQYFNLPEIIPTHFNAQGKADDFGSKETLFLLPAIAIFTYALIIIVNRFPHMHNYMVNITEDNALKNYRLSTRVLRFVNLFCLLLFGYVSYIMVESAKGNEITQGKWFLPLVIGLSVVAPILLIFYMRRLNK